MTNAWFLTRRFWCLIHDQSCLWLDKMSFDTLLQINYKWSKLCSFQRNYQWPLGILHIQLHFMYENMLEPFLFCRPIWYSYLVMAKIILPRNRSNAKHNFGNLENEDIWNWLYDRHVVVMCFFKNETRTCTLTLRGFLKPLAWKIINVKSSKLKPLSSILNFMIFMTNYLYIVARWRY